MVSSGGENGVGGDKEGETLIGCRQKERSGESVDMTREDRPHSILGTFWILLRGTREPL